MEIKLSNSSICLIILLIAFSNLIAIDIAPYQVASTHNSPLSIMSNPALIDQSINTTFLTEYNTQYIGFANDVIHDGRLGFVGIVPNWFGYGISIDYFDTGIYYQTIIGLSFGRNVLKNINIGLRLEPRFNGFRRNNLQLDDLEDPLFSDYGYSSSGLSLDLGTNYKIGRKFAVGLFVDDALPADMSLAKIGDFGTTFHLGGYGEIYDNFSTSLDIAFATNDVDGSYFDLGIDVQYALISDGFTIDAGSDLHSLDCGFTIDASRWMPLSLIYNLDIPFGEMWKEGTTKHRFILAYQPIFKKRPDPIDVHQPAKILETTSSQDTTFDVEIDLDDPILEIQSLTHFYEEAPILPIIFFEPGSDVIDNRFDSLIETIAERLGRNPDVELQLNGFFDPFSESFDDGLPFRRAEAVRNRLIAINPELVSRIEILRDGYPFDKARIAQRIRAESSSTEQSDEQLDMINAENRRAEMLVSISPARRIDLELIPSDLDLFADALTPLLTRNPDIELSIRGNVQDAGSIFEMQAELENALQSKYADQIYTVLNANATTHVALTADRILFRPRLAERMTVYDRSMRKLKITIVPKELPESHYIVSIVDSLGNTSARLFEGRELPGEIEWDWQDSTGELISPGESYRLAIDCDGYGRIESNEMIEAKINGSTTIDSKLLIVQFVFDESRAQSEYLENRLQQAVSMIVESAAEKHDSIHVVVSGHTDIIGSQRRNDELSSERAKREYYRIRRYLMHQLELPSEDDIDVWLSNNKITMDWHGAGSDVPFVVKDVSAYYEDVILIGDNSTPEGRSYNRRVIIEIETFISDR